MGSGPCGDGDLLVGRVRGGSDCGTEDAGIALQAVEVDLDYSYGGLGREQGDVRRSAVLLNYWTHGISSQHGLRLTHSANISIRTASTSFWVLALIVPGFFTNRILSTVRI